MAVNKNALLRYKALDNCFSNYQRKFYFNDLLKEVNKALESYDPDLEGIKTRQLREDIKFMRSAEGYDAPIITIAEGKKHYYQYEDKDFSIQKSPLNAEEAEMIKRSLSVIQRFAGNPTFEWAQQLIPMLSTRFGLNEAPKNILSFESNLDYTGHDKILPFFNAIQNERVLSVCYKPFDQEASELVFHPYHLRQYNNRWFVLGLNESMQKETWNLALDRVLDVNELPNVYKHSTTDWEEHFYDVIGVSVPDDKEAETVELLFSKEQANYIKTKPLHASQRAKELATGELKVGLKVKPNYELEMLLLSFGEKVTILQPASLRNAIIGRLQAALNKYI